MTEFSTLVTDNLDIWTSAIERRSAAGRGRGKNGKNGKISLYGVAKLRALILDLAVRGKLVPQDPNDEPASKLLKRIKAEKAKLIKEGKIKKTKPLPPIQDEEKPFDLPEGWEWVRLGEVCVLENGDRGKNYPNKSVLVEAGVPFVNAGHLQNGRIDINQMTFITKERYELLNGGKFQENDILFCLRGSLGKTAIVSDVPEGSIASSLVIVRSHKIIDVAYLHLYFNTNLSYSMIKIYDNGTAQPNLSSGDLVKFLAPLPPLAEQKRIVAKVDELMALCDALEAGQYEAIEAHELLVKNLLATLVNSKDAHELAENWARIETHFDILFTTEASIDQLKQTILQLAVMGKLVPQNPNDEPALELLKRIKTEKARLIKEGKIKKTKPLPPIKDNEKPFDLPEGWEWVRLSQLSIVGTGATPSRTRQDYYQPGEINWVTSGETHQDYILETKEKISAKAVEETNVSIYPPATLVIALYGQGKTRGQITELKIHAGTNQACAAIQLVEKTVWHKKYFRYFFEHSYHNIRAISAGGAQPNLNVGKIASLAVPHPPLAEQKRIVAKVDKLTALCDQLKARLAEATTTQKHLAATIVTKAVA